LPKPADYSGVTWGDESISGGAIYMRNSTGNRNRTFDVAGSEVRTRYAFTIGSIANELLGGVRFMAEKAHEVRVNGVFAGDLSGEISDEEYRPVYGYSAFVSDKVALGKQLEITPGVRAEFMQFNREIIRGKYKINNVTTARDTSIENSGSLMQMIPGVGFSYLPVKQVTVFGGVHRGFAPPRIKDAITSDGTDQELSAELSWNYELGIRSVLMKGVRMEITAFLLDFENQVIPVSESSGGTGTGLMNGGGTESKGLEASLSLNTADIRKTKWSSEILVNATYTQASFNGDRFTGTAETKVNINGKKLPYVPEWSGNVLLSVLSPYHLRLNCNLQYTGEQYTDVLNTETPSANGLVGLLPSFYTIDAGLGFDWIKANTTITASVKNLTDERYIYTRRPQGIRVGLERMIYLGVKKRF
jgi:Fe(3+) dicitrate transport protein